MWPDLAKFWQTLANLKGLFSIWAKFGKLLMQLGKFLCCQWPNIEKVVWPSGHSLSLCLAECKWQKLQVSRYRPFSITLCILIRASVTRWPDYWLYIWPFITVEICIKVHLFPFCLISILKTRPKRISSRNQLFSIFLLENLVRKVSKLWVSRVVKSLVKLASKISIC